MHCGIVLLRKKEGQNILSDLKGEQAALIQGNMELIALLCIYLELFDWGLGTE